MIRILIILSLIFFSSCNSSGDGEGGFANLNPTPPPVVTPPDSTVTSAPVVVEFSPVASPVVMLSTGSQVFGLTINPEAGVVDVSFFLDAILVYQGNSLFYVINSAALATGAHNLRAVITNALGSTEHTFNIIKNTPPSISLSANTPTNIICGVSTFELQVSAFDADGDAITFSYLLNGVAAPTVLTGNSTLTTASVIFNPTCAFAGANTVSIRAADSNGEFSDYSMLVTVGNPNVASIDSFSPLANPVNILSSGNTSFSISASGNPPLSYSWVINPGGTIASCANNPTCLINSGSFSPGLYTLTATVTDALLTSDNKAYDVVINGAPEVSSVNPDNGERFKMDCSTSKNFQVNFTDGNFPNSPTQTYSVEWRVNGVASAAIGSTPVSGGPVMNSVATFSPNCSATLLGDLVIQAIISDGLEQQSVQWDVRTNYFSDTCNTLSSGRVCTLAGLTHMENFNYSSHKDVARIRPLNIIPNENVGYFIVDDDYRSIYYHNTTVVPQTIVGVSVGANEVKIVAGTGGVGNGVSGQNSLNFSFRRPWSVAYSSTGELYVSDYDLHYIVRITNTGIASIWAGGGANNASGDDQTVTGTRLSHRCVNPKGLALDESVGLLFVGCYENNNFGGGVKSFSLTEDRGYRVLRREGSTNNVNGTLGSAGTARFGTRINGLVKDPNRRVLYTHDIQRCEVMALNYGEAAGASFYDGDLIVPLNEARRIVQTNNQNCSDGVTTNVAWNSTAARLRADFIYPYSVGGETRGLFISNYARHHVMFVNFTGSAITLGGRAVSAKSHHIVFGVNNSANYARGTPAYLGTNLRNPQGISYNPTTQQLLVADYANFVIASLSTAVSNGASSDYLGFPSNYDGEDNKHAQRRYLNRPRSLAFDQGRQTLWVADNDNRRLREIDLVTGQMSTTIGFGSWGASNSNPENPINTFLTHIGDLAVSPLTGELLYSERQETGNQANRNCLVRSFNSSGALITSWGQNIPSQRIHTVAGNYALGCGPWVVGPSPYESPVDGDNAVDFRISDPTGLAIAPDNSKFYLSIRHLHTILSVDEFGALAFAAGTPGSVGTFDGVDVGTGIGNLKDALLELPGDLEIDSDETLADYGNFFFVDRSLTTNSRLRYVNLSPSDVVLGGLDMKPNSAGTFLATTTHSHIAAVASFANQICYTRGYAATTHDRAHGVVCFDRATGTQTLVLGSPEAAAVKGGLPATSTAEGGLPGAMRMRDPYGITFDDQGNLYVVDFQSIKMIKRWW